MSSPQVAALHAAGKLPDRFAVIDGGRCTSMDRRDLPAWRAPKDLDEARCGGPGGKSQRNSGRDALPAGRPRGTGEHRLGGYRRGSGRPHAPSPCTRPRRPICSPQPCGCSVRIDLPVGSRAVVEKPFGVGPRQRGRPEPVACRSWPAGSVRPERSGSTTSLDLRPYRASLQDPRRRHPTATSGTNTHVETIEVVWEETLGPEGRAAYYDRAGQLRDMIQNHLIQVLCLLSTGGPRRSAGA